MNTARLPELGPQSDLADVLERIVPRANQVQRVGRGGIAGVFHTLEDHRNRQPAGGNPRSTEEQGITLTANSVAEALKKAGFDVKMPRSPLVPEIDRLDDRPAHPNAGTDWVGSQLISSAVRHVFEIADGEFARAFKKAILPFGESGYAEVSTTNWFRTRSPTFVGIKTVLATGCYRFEVEYHTADSYKAKIDNHDTYKELQKLRELQRESREPLDQYLAEQLLERVRQACNEVVIPESAIEISHLASQLRPFRRSRRVQRCERPTV
ncbi:hypothetical protein [Bradyrhizobium elkanii]|uniref:hypothetical protein n=1 Tax=Bradyrhizobium elkanii TaxID=29448 RepID=UPI002010E068|nr:hypothetical protein [Bradyrhizobium elkanii]